MSEDIPKDTLEHFADLFSEESPKEKPKKIPKKVIEHPLAKRAPNQFVEPYMTWENGNYVKKFRIGIGKEDVTEMKLYAAQQTYVGDWDPIEQNYIVDERYVGMSKLEVAQHKQMDAAARGDLTALAQAEDRILGKPKQQVESIQVSATLEDFLEKVAEKEGMALASPPLFSGEDVIEGEVVGSEPSQRLNSGGMDI